MCVCVYVCMWVCVSFRVCVELEVCCMEGCSGSACLWHVHAVGLNITLNNSWSHIIMFIYLFIFLLFHSISLLFIKFLYHFGHNKMRVFFFVSFSRDMKKKKKKKKKRKKRKHRPPSEAFYETECCCMSLMWTHYEGILFISRNWVIKCNWKTRSNTENWLILPTVVGHGRLHCQSVAKARHFFFPVSSRRIRQSHQNRKSRIHSTGTPWFMTNDREMASSLKAIIMTIEVEILRTKRR